MQEVWSNHYFTRNRRWNAKQPVIAASKLKTRFPILNFSKFPQLATYNCNDYLFYFVLQLLGVVHSASFSRDIAVNVSEIVLTMRWVDFKK